MALSRGPRVFHVNSEDDVPKLEGWLKRGPKYVLVRQHEGSPRKLHLFSQENGKELNVGIIVSMSRVFNRDAVEKIAQKWRATK